MSLLVVSRSIMCLAVCAFGCVAARRGRGVASAWRRAALRQAVGLAILAWCCALPSSGAAQPMGEVVVVPFGVGDTRAALDVTSMLEAELAHERVSLIPLHDARDRFTARSRPPQTASDSDLDVLAREAREAIEHVAFGRTAAAQKSVREVIARAEKTLESLNRETATARHILDACLSLVRTTLQTGRRDLAIEQATRCRRLVPDLVPSEANHPANVVGVLAEADNMLRRMRIGHLAVRSTPESNCSVYLNGRHLGTTPFQLDRAAAGDYRVQVECGASVGRVHVVQLGDQAVSLLVDTQFDRSVVSDPRLLLRYDSREQAREQAVSHAIQLGREVHADDVVLISVVNERAELLRVQVAQQRLVARASVPWTAKHGFTRPALETAIVALAEGRFEGEPSLDKSTQDEPKLSAEVAPRVEPKPTPQAPAPTPAVPVEPDPAQTSVTTSAPRATSTGWSRERRVRAVGWTALGASAALFTVGVIFDARTQQRLNQLSDLSLVSETDGATEPAIAEAAARQLDKLQPEYERARELRWIGVGGGIVGTAAAAMLVRAQPSVPWWGYTLGGAGVLLVAVGAYEVSRDSKCDLNAEDSCRRPHDSGARGALLMTAAAPFLSVPLLQWLKPERAESLSLSGGATMGGLSLMLRGTY